MSAHELHESLQHASKIRMGAERMTKDGGEYNQLDNHHRDSDTSTEVDIWDTDGDLNPFLRRRRSIWSRLGSYRWLLDTALLLIIVGLLVEKRWKDGEHKTSRYEIGGDMTGFAPTFSQQITTFRPDPVFAPEDAFDFWSNATQQAWLDIVPVGLGYVDIKDPSTHDNLPQPIHDYPNNTVFTTSMTHQLHCLYTILEAYNTMSISLDVPGATVNPIHRPWHVNHCFEYIRQAIMCTGDVALEGAATTFPSGPNGEDLGGSDGWDAKHVCKDYGQITKYLEKEAINQRKWISSE